MSMILGPTYSHSGAAAMQSLLEAGAFGSVLDTPIAVMQLAQPILGDPVLLEPGGDPHVLPLAIPHLPGLDEIEVVSASFRIASAARLRSQSVSATDTGADKQVPVTLSGIAPGQAVFLSRVRIEGLQVTPEGATAAALAGSGGTVYWRQAEAGVVSQTSSPGGSIQHLHVLVRPGTSGGAGPPIAAAPHFAMPGEGSSLYGPALGAAVMSVTRRSDGKVDVSLTLSPAQAMTAVTVMVGTAAPTGTAIPTHDGLPTDMRGASWSADTVEAEFDTRPAGITVTASAGAMDPASGALVVQFDTDPGGSLREVDFAPAARAVLDEGYPSAQGGDLGLELRVEVAASAALHLQPGSVSARYVQRPLPVPEALSLKGAPEVLRLPVPPGLRPSGLSFRADGTYGPARLVLAADTTPPSPREGWRIAAGTRVARRLTLSATERNLPLSRLAVFGRASVDGEVLITRHGGDELRIGPALTPPVSLPVTASDVPRWHRGQIPLRDGLPPHQDACWIVIQATKGVFWWHGETELSLPPGVAQASGDGGTSWSAVPGQPLLQAWVDEVDAGSGTPAPLLPLSLAWDGGVLNADIVGVSTGAAPPDFTRLWLAEGAAHAAFLEAVAGVGGTLTLHFDCRRDVELSLSDVALSYDPWTAGGGA